VSVRKGVRYRCLVSCWREKGVRYRCLVSCWRGRVGGTSALVPVAGRALLLGFRDIGLSSVDAALCASSSAGVIGMLTRRGPAAQEVNNGT
jgi:hypothetical protein